MDKIHLATVGAPFGVRGAFRLKTLTEDPLDSLSYGPLFDETGHAHTFHLVRVENAHTLVVTSPSISDRTAAELWKGQKLFMDKDKLPTLTDASDADTFYMHDLVGMRIVSIRDNTHLGDVVRIVNYGASDILIVKTDTGEAQIAFTHDAVHHVDAQARTITVEPGHLI